MGCLWGLHQWCRAATPHPERPCHPLRCTPALIKASAIQIGLIWKQSVCHCVSCHCTEQPVGQPAGTVWHVCSCQTQSVHVTLSDAHLTPSKPATQKALTNGKYWPLHAGAVVCLWGLRGQRAAATSHPERPHHALRRAWISAESQAHSCQCHPLWLEECRATSSAQRAVRLQVVAAQA